jgi:hypothetical protein
MTRQIVFHNQDRLRKNDEARRTAAMTKQSCQKPLMNPFTRSQVKISANELILMAKDLASMTSDPLTYAETMYSPHHPHWKLEKEKECTSIWLNNTFTIVNSPEGRQLRVKSIVSKGVYKTKHNADGTMRYIARLVMKCYEQTDFGGTYAPVGKFNTFWYLLSMFGNHGWHINLLDLVTAILNPGIDDDDIYMTMCERSPEGLNAPTIDFRLMKAL